ncbi:heavy metal-associated isoprenylated plant protein 31-like [Rhodamnia argentea]|uniref:Heavy metal-associated isoprenylated plant protein 31-like n=1 Tax=Rhodamnia argentea TaxID=178133 RepID=A0A8B8QL63_9MYRT|nr:heavy metal-associated isoprenylated plant protein 31-like [Rhodamnia argentea]
MVRGLLRSLVVKVSPEAAWKYLVYGVQYSSGRILVSSGDAAAPVSIKAMTWMDLVIYGRWSWTGKCGGWNVGEWILKESARGKKERISPGAESESEEVGSKIVETHVNMDFQGCGENIRSALNKLEGVQDVDINLDMQKVTVAGFVDERKVLLAEKDTGKSAQTWQHQTTHLYCNSFDHYQYDQMSHGRSPPPNSHYAQPTYMTRHYKHGELMGKASYDVYMYSDDTGSSCSIM